MKKLSTLFFLVLINFSINAQCWQKVTVGQGWIAIYKNDGTVWGLNQQMPYLINPFPDWASSEFGSSFQAIIKTNGTLWTRFHNADGQLGDGTFNYRMNYVQIGTATWQKIAPGLSHSLAIQTNGTLWMWGNGVNTPTQVGTENNWVSAAAGRGHQAAIKSDGTLWVWGTNTYGQLGNGTTANNTIITQLGTDTDWQAVSCGDAFTLALKNNGTLWVWGRNSEGQHGNGTYSDSLVPMQIGTDTNWQLIATGESHVVASKTDGTLWAWGGNYHGEVGDGTHNNRNLPVLIATAPGWQSISAKIYNNAAVTTTGNLIKWGDNTTASNLTPVSIICPENIEPEEDEATQCWRMTSMGFGFIMNIKMDGTLWGSGYNGSGQIGDGTTTSRPTPVQVGTDTDWLTVSAGNNNTYAIKTNGTVWAWGQNYNGQVGDGTTTLRLSPVQIGSDNNWTSIRASSPTIALKADGTIWSWMPSTWPPTPPQVQIGTANDWQSIFGGFGTHFAIKTNGTLWAWGGNSVNSVYGNGMTNGSATPIQIGTDNNWLQVATNSYSAAAIRTDGTLWTWGTNTMGQLGLGNNVAQMLPVQVGSETNWTSVSVGAEFIVAAKNDGTLWISGSNYNGVYGNGINGTYGNGSGQNGSWNVFTRIGYATNWQQVSTGPQQTTISGIKSNHTRYAWGNNYSGQIGNGQYVNAVYPLQISCNENLGIEEPEPVKLFTVYPNPVKNLLQLQSQQTIEKVTVIDLTGKKMIERYGNVTQLDLAHLETGLYLLQVTIGGQQYSEKIVKN